MLKLTEFLRARLDDDQEDVRAGRLRAVPSPEWPEASCVVENLYTPVTHRLLNEIESKRQIVRAYEDAVTSFGHTEVGTAVHELMGGSVNSLRHVLCLLTLPYRAHPDFKQEWLP